MIGYIYRILSVLQVSCLPKLKLQTQLSQDIVPARLAFIILVGGKQPVCPSSRALPEVLLGAIFKKDRQYQFYSLGYLC